MNFDLIFLPFLAGIVVAFTHVPLGINSFKRKMTFINLTFAKFSALGIVFSHSLFDQETSYIATVEYMFSMVFAIALAAFLGLADKKFPEKQEAITGAAFIFALCMCVLLSGPSDSAHLYNVLSGKILWVTKFSLLQICLLYFLIFTILAALFKTRVRKFNAPLSILGLYLIFAIVIAQSVQLVGVLMVASFLILPVFTPQALNTLFKKLLYCYIISSCALIGGLLISGWFGLRAGPTIVLTLMIFSGISFICVKKYYQKGQKKTIKRVPRRHR